MSKAKAKGNSRAFVKTRHPGIFKREGRYYHAWRPNGRQRRDPYLTLGDALRAQARVADGDRTVTPRTPFREYAEIWKNTYRGRTSYGLSENTRREYNRDIDLRAIPYFGKRALTDISRPGLRRWFDWLEEQGISQTGVRKARAALSALLATAHDDGLIPLNPAAGLRYIPSEPAVEKEKRFLTLEEWGRFMDALPSQWRLFFYFLSHTGTRISEVCGLRWTNVDLGDHPKIRVVEQFYKGERIPRTKTRFGRRTIRLSTGMAQALQRLKDETEFASDDSPVFASKRGTPLHAANLWNRALQPTGVKANLLRPREDWSDPEKPESWVSFHAFRHFLGSVAMSEQTPRELCDWLGHHDPNFSIRAYTHQLQADGASPDFLDIELALPDEEQLAPEEAPAA